MAEEEFRTVMVKAHSYSANANAFANRCSPLVSFTFSKKRNQSTAEVIATRGGSRTLRKGAPILGGMTKIS